MTYHSLIDPYGIDNSSRRIGRVVFYDYFHYPLMGLSAIGPTEYRKCEMNGPWHVELLEVRFSY
jgi:hypothetical protein